MRKHGFEFLVVDTGDFTTPPETPYDPLRSADGCVTFTVRRRGGS